MTKREPDGSQDMDDFFAEVERRHAMPGMKGFFVRLWHHRQYYLRLPVEWPRDRYEDLVAFWQRGRRGWADRDVWDMDTSVAEMTAPMLRYLATVIAPMLRNMAETAPGIPGNCGLDMHAISVEEESEELRQWKAYLLGLADAFDEYISIRKSDDHFLLSSCDDVLEKMRHLFDHYPNLWT